MFKSFKVASWVTQVGFMPRLTIIETFFSVVVTLTLSVDDLASTADALTSAADTLTRMV